MSVTGEGLEPGDVLGGRWRVDRFIASGGFGRVFAATDTSAAAIGSVAVKVLLEGASTAERQAFLREVAHMAALRHPNLVAHIDSGLIDQHEQGAVFLVTELCEESLSDFCARQPGGVVPEPQLTSLIGDISSGLDHLHQSGRVHRDLKPANILRSGDVWKLADFGLVRDLTASGVYHLNAVAGTPRYMAPEFFAGGDIGPAADLWSVGVLVHELASGASVHSGEGAAFILNIASTDPEISPTLPPTTALLVQRCLAREPGERPSAASLPNILNGTDRTPSPVTEPAEAPGSGGAASFDPAVTGVVPAEVVPAVPTRSSASGSPAPTGKVGGSAAELGPAPTVDGKRRRGPLIGAMALLAVLLLAGGLFAASRLGDGSAEESTATEGPEPASSSETDDAGTAVDSTETDNAGTEAGSGTEDGTEPEGPETSDGTEASDPAASEPPVGGEEVGLADLEVGDCVDPELVDDGLALRRRLRCTEPHIYEVVAIFESPDAGGDYPSRQELFDFGAIQCAEAFKARYGISDPETSLQMVSYRPTEEDWNNNIFTVACVVNTSDSSPLTEPLGDDISEWVWKSGDTLSFLELQPENCFDLAGELVQAGINQRVIFRDCDELHDGEKFWNVLLLDLDPVDGSYPDEIIAEESETRCHDTLHQGYGPNHHQAGLTSTAIFPTVEEWAPIKVAACVTLFDEPIDTTLATRVNS